MDKETKKHLDTLKRSGNGFKYMFFFPALAALIALTKLYWGQVVRFLQYPYCTLFNHTFKLEVRKYGIWPELKEISEFPSGTRVYNQCIHCGYHGDDTVKLTIPDSYDKID